MTLEAPARLVLILGSIAAFGPATASTSFPDCAASGGPKTGAEMYCCCAAACTSASLSAMRSLTVLMPT